VWLVHSLDPHSHIVHLFWHFFPSHLFIALLIALLIAPASPSSSSFAPCLLPQHFNSYRASPALVEHIMPLQENLTDRGVLTVPHDAIQQCKDAFGFAPKDLQLRVVEHIGRGEDCILIARCGWGKSLVYFLPLVLWRDCIIIVISPSRC
jgi:hypothetical protein